MYGAGAYQLNVPMPAIARNFLLSNKSSISLLLLFAVAWAVLLFSLPNTAAVIREYIAYTFLGVVGAIFANATGAGGGVVFIPAFEHLNFSGAQSVATSFGIQCLGMATGAIAWTRFYRKEQQTGNGLRWQPFVKIVAIVSPCSVAGLWWIYSAHVPAPGSLSWLFATFSIVLGIGILATSLWFKPKTDWTRVTLPWADMLPLALIGLLGGAITAWLSVGVGEVLAIYLILRRYDAIIAVASAVVVSAVTVLSGIAEHLFINPQLFAEVVMFAGPGAVIGAILARRLASRMPVLQLKLLFSIWVLLMGLGSVFSGL